MKTKRETDSKTSSVDMTPMAEPKSPLAKAYPGTFGVTRWSGLAVFFISATILLLTYLQSFIWPGSNIEMCSRISKLPNLIEATTEQLVNGLEARHFTSLDLVKAYIERINEVDAALNVIAEINPDVLDIASALDEERAQGKTRSSIHGLPYLLKDNIATNDRMQNLAGSYALKGAKVPRDAGVVTKLRAAGVIVLGKVNLSQWANFRSINSSNGWSATGGQVTAPYYPHQDPCGSSSGSAVAAAIGLAVAAVGTETRGSIICPSENNNVVGIKPTTGLTSRSLVIPISEHQDTIGPMARTVKDAAYLLQTLAGVDEHDNYTSAIPFATLPNYVQHCSFDALRGARLGIPRNMMEEHHENNEHYEHMMMTFEAALKTMRDAGATLIDNANVTRRATETLYNDSIFLGAMMADFLSGLPKLYLSQLLENPHNITSVENLREFTRQYEPEAFPDRDTARWDDTLEQGFGNTDARFWPLREHMLQIGGPDGIDGALQNNSLDALLVPTQFASQLPALIGGPVITVPLGSYPPNTTVVINARGLVEKGPNIPFGLSFIGPRWSEAKLVSYAYAFEQRTLARYNIAPYIAPSTDLEDIVPCQS